MPSSRVSAQAAASGDPRPSIESRFAGRDDYLGQVRSAAGTLVRDRYLLDADVDTCVDIAAERYDEVLRATASTE